MELNALSYKGRQACIENFCRRLKSFYESGLVLETGNSAKDKLTDASRQSLLHQGEINLRDKLSQGQEIEVERLKPGAQWTKWEKEPSTPLSKDLEAVFLFDKIRKKVIDLIAQELSRRVSIALENLGRIIPFSLDIEEVDTLRAEMKIAIPPKQRILYKDFFAKVEALTNHLRANACFLPLKDGSIFYFALIEFWPFHCQDKMLFDQLLKEIARCLAPGGKAAFFP